jgi:hypothetical protein
MLLTQLQATVTALALKGAVPLWLVAAAGIIGGILGSAHQVGFGVGFGVAGLVVSGYAGYLLMQAIRSGVPQRVGQA